METVTWLGYVSICTSKSVQKKKNHENIAHNLLASSKRRKRRVQDCWMWSYRGTGSRGICFVFFALIYLFLIFVFSIEGHEQVDVGEKKKKTSWSISFGYQQPATHGTRTCSLLTRLSSGSYRCRGLEQTTIIDFSTATSNHSQLRDIHSTVAVTTPTTIQR